MNNIDIDTNVHDEGLSPSVMKALATESRRHRGKAFFSSPCLCACVAIFFHGKVFPVLPELRSANKTGFLSAFFKAFVLVAPGLKLGMCCDGKQCDSAFCDHLEGGRRKKQKSVEPQRHQGTKAPRKLFLFAHAAQASPKKLCVFVPLWFPSFQSLL